MLYLSSFQVSGELSDKHSLLCTVWPKCTFFTICEKWVLTSMPIIKVAHLNVWTSVWVALASHSMCENGDVQGVNMLVGCSAISLRVWTHMWGALASNSGCEGTLAP